MNPTNTNNPLETIFRWRLAGGAALAILVVGTASLWAADQGFVRSSGFSRVVPPEGGTTNPAGPQQVWLISTRQVSRCAGQDEEHLPIRYSRLAPDQTWVDADQEAFLASDDPAVPTCIFVHGNRQTSQSAIRTGMTTYRRLLGECSSAASHPVRFVIWSWPTEEVCRRNRDDLQVKASRSDCDAYLLAVCLDRIRPDVRVSLVGYSFGARVVTGALELLGGGQVAGKKLAQRANVGRLPVRAVLVAAALDNDWLLPGHCEGLALDQAEAVLITQNGCDPVLRWYPRLYGRGGPEALGYTGPACSARLGDEQGKLDLLGVTCSVGKSHDWLAYLGSSSLRTRIEQYVFPAEPEQAVKAAASDQPAAISNQQSAVSDQPSVASWQSGT